MCTDLRPPSIDYLGLGSAITSYVQDWEERTQVKVKLKLGENLVRLPEEIELSIFRIIQESLFNTEKHAKAHNVDISQFEAVLLRMNGGAVTNQFMFEFIYDTIRINNYKMEIFF